MTSGHGDPQIPPTPALTRRELRERERTAESNQPVPGPSAAAGQALEQRDGINALFGPPAAGNTFVPPAPAESAARLAYTPPTSTPPSARPTASARTLGGSQIATNQSSSKRPKRIARTIGSRLLSVGALVFAGALAFGMSVPANAFYTPSSALAAEAQEAAPKALQSVEVAANVESATATRDTWRVLSWAEVLKERYGTRNFDYSPGMGADPLAVPGRGADQFRIRRARCSVSRLLEPPHGPRLQPRWWCRGLRHRRRCRHASPGRPMGLRQSRDHQPRDRRSQGHLDLRPHAARNLAAQPR